jgi:hypothetical protein
MKHKFLFLGTWGFLSTTLFSCADVKKNSQELTVCSVSANPEHFSGKIITVSGRLESDGIERTTLMDEGCEGTGIAISAPTHFKGEAGLTKAFEKGHPGTLDKRIAGTLVGKFEWHPQAVSPKRLLVLKEARNISVVMK